ncbi:MAG: hypothetical protein CO167_05925 [Candidatus Marinimicrobia bacterium CG_4_9_14_3_um_filter_48_9]|nr:MAG: hypothetical protein CO167_05925 [Candidatus Marinimicrobia bacterium CG_4_9_14_3_um_filter_48_9]
MQPLLSPKEAAVLLNISYHSVLDLINQGLLKAYLIGNRFKVSQNQLSRFLESTKVK